MAPTCSVQIGAVPSVAEHPIGPFLRTGFNVGYNTDNRLMSNVMPSSFVPMETPRRIVAERIQPAYASR